MGMIDGGISLPSPGMEEPMQNFSLPCSKNATIVLWNAPYKEAEVSREHA
jgi:hypothetical protein